MKFNLAVNKNNFEFNYVIGKGGFGKVNFILDFEGMEGFTEKNEKKLRIEGNVQSKDN